MLEELPGVAEAFVVAGPIGQIREPRGEMGLGVTNEPGLRGEPQQGLDHRQRDQLGVGELGRDPHRRPLGTPFGMINEQIVDSDVESRREGVQFRVHALCPSGSEFVYAP